VTSRTPPLWPPPPPFVGSLAYLSDALPIVFFLHVFVFGCHQVSLLDLSACVDLAADGSLEAMRRAGISARDLLGEETEQWDQGELVADPPSPGADFPCALPLQLCTLECVCLCL
jgi:hypothetical protein